MLSASCTTEEELKENRGTPFSAQTRTDNSAIKYAGLQPEEQIDVYIIERTETDAKTSLKPTGNTFDSLLSSCQSGGILKPQDEAYYPLNIDYANLYAYAPYDVVTEVDSDRLLLFFVQQDQSSSGLMRESDLLWSKKLSVSTTSVPVLSLTFNYYLSKPTINLKAGTGVTLGNTAVKVAEIKISTKSNVIDGALAETRGDMVKITPIAHAGKFEYETIVIPQTVTERTKLFDIISSGKVYYCMMEDSKEFNPGTRYACDITTNADDLKVEITSTTNGWNTGETTTETIS